MRAKTCRRGGSGPVASALSESLRHGTGSGQRRALLTLARKERSREVRGGAGAVEGWG